MLAHFFFFLLCISLFTLIVQYFSVCFRDENCFYHIHLKRWVISVLISLIVASWGLKRKSLDWTGAVSGVLVGSVLTFSSYCFMACMLTFFYTSSKATHFCSGKKRKFETDFKQGGQRNWIQVICNGGVALEIAIFYLLYGGAGEYPINFSKNYIRSWLSTAVLSSLAGANGDTWASELGTVLSRSEPRLITSFKKVPVGTNGGFTLSGLLFSALGGFVVGVAYFIALWITEVEFEKSHQAILLTFIGILSGIFGSVIDSVIGATLQYSGLDTRSGKIVEKPGIGVQHISGLPVLSNHSVNLIMSIINSIVVPTITFKLYPLFS